MAYSYNPEKIGRRRLPDNKQYRTQLNSEASLILSALQDLLPSNYPKDESTNLAILYRVLAREFSRQQDSINLISNDKVFTETRPEYLHQILGERLFLQDRIAPVNSNDVLYREFLISIKDAYLQGSKKSVIEDMLSKFTKLSVNIKELYLEARKPNSAATLVDTHKMRLEIFLDELDPNRDIAALIRDLPFFVNLVKPAHVLYDTAYILPEVYAGNKIHDLIFGDLGGGCVPKYIYTPFSHKTVIAQKIRVVDSSTPITGGIYEIGSIHSTELVLYLEDDTKVIVEPGSNGTLIYGLSGHRIPFTDLLIGQKIQLIYLTIPGDFNFYYMPPNLVGLPTDQLFYKNIFREPAFQEFVMKQMDSKGRFPLQIATDPSTMCDRWVQDVIQPLYEDLRTNCEDRSELPKNFSFTLAPRMWSPRFAVDNTLDGTSHRALSGDLYSFTVPYSPLTDVWGNAATISDVAVSRDGTNLIGAIEAVDASSSTVSLTISPEFWDSTTIGGAPAIGSDLEIDYFYVNNHVTYFGSTSFVFGINCWQLSGAPISDGSGSNLLAYPSDVRVSIDGTYVPDAVQDLQAVTGYVTLHSDTAFWLGSSLGRIPQLGDQFSFDYYQSGRKSYAILLDDPSRTMDGDMVFDGPDDMDFSRAPIPLEDPLQVSYKFRADLLYHASVLNSWDTLKLNNYLKPVKRASLAHKKDSLNHFNYFFSPEHLTDKDSGIILNDKYLDKDIPAAITLNEGTPPFQKTFGYQPGVIKQHKLQDIRTNNKLLMYSDLLLKESRSGSSNVNLSSICDNNNLGFKVQFKETLNKLEECPDWLIFDTAETKEIEVTIPGDVVPVLDLRMSDKNLRDDLILRETESTGLATISQSFHLDRIEQTQFILSPTIQRVINGIVVDFPALPIKKDIINNATPEDVVISVNGVVTPLVIDVGTFDPVNGIIQIDPPEPALKEEYITIDQTILDRPFISLSQYPLNGQVAVNVVGGPSQITPKDFLVYGSVIFLQRPLLNILAIGDELVISYEYSILSNADITFTYKVFDTATVTIIDLDRSRVLDNDDVFASWCYNGFQQKFGYNYTEYINFLDDYSKGIKYKYFNKDTDQIEELIFSGPVFETYCPIDDEISGVESFPNALVRIKNPLSQTNPLDIMMNFDFLNDTMVRIRKKTVNELLPDRTFRSMEIIEAMPI